MAASIDYSDAKLSSVEKLVQYVERNEAEKSHQSLFKITTAIANQKGLVVLEKNLLGLSSDMKLTMVKIAAYEDLLDRFCTVYFTFILWLYSMIPRRIQKRLRSCLRKGGYGNPLY